MLHGGRVHSDAPARAVRLAYLRMVPIARMLASAGHAAGVGVGLVRYRTMGWNGARADALRDTLQVLDRTREGYPEVPVVLVGHSMGGRAALLAAGHPSVVAVCGLAPWVGPVDPVAQLAGRAVLLAHGDRDRITSPAGSLEFATRARAVSDRVCRFEVHGDGHPMLRRRRAWCDLTRTFVLGELGVEPMAPQITNAFGTPAPYGLRAELTE
ncbi:MAG TPA: alpha/beta fold hydrolase [Pseudonocardia sp.]